MHIFSVKKVFLVFTNGNVSQSYKCSGNSMLLLTDDMYILDKHRVESEYYHLIKMSLKIVSLLGNKPLLIHWKHLTILFYVKPFPDIQTTSDAMLLLQTTWMFSFQF